MPIAIPAFIGTAISIILAFKLNQSYERWWEASKIWGSIVSDSRSLVLQMQSFISNSEKATIKKIAYRQIAWCYSLGQSLRGEKPVKNLEKLISAVEIASINYHDNKPLFLLQLNVKDIASLKEKGHLDVYSKLKIDDTFVRLCNSMGGSERIKATVFPVTYRIFLRFIIYLFVITLASSLKDVEIYFELPLLLVISSIFFLLEKTSGHLQDPFSGRPTDIAVTYIARTIEINIKQLLNEIEIPEPSEPNTYYLS